jgi:hypothetical protein
MIILGLLPGGLPANNANKIKTTTISTVAAAAVALQAVTILLTIQKYSHPRFQRGSASCLQIFGNNLSISHWKLILALANLRNTRI